MFSFASSHLTSPRPSLRASSCSSSSSSSSSYLKSTFVAINLPLHNFAHFLDLSVDACACVRFTRDAKEEKLGSRSRSERKRTGSCVNWELVAASSHCMLFPS